MHEVQIHIIESKVFQRLVDALKDSLVPGVVKLGGDPDLASGHAGLLDTHTDLIFIAICQCTGSSQMESSSIVVLGSTYVSMCR